MSLCSLKVKNLSDKFGSPGKWPWISPASVTGSAWGSAVFHRGELLWHFPGAPSRGLLQAPWWRHFCLAPFSSLGQGPGAASELWNLRASELLSWEPPRVRKLGTARTGCATRVVLLHGFLGSPRAVQKFQLVRTIQDRNQVPSEFNHKPRLHIPWRFQEFLLNGKLSLSHTFGSCCFLGICP